MSPLSRRRPCGRLVAVALCVGAMAVLSACAGAEASVRPMSSPTSSTASSTASSMAPRPAPSLDVGRVPDSGVGLSAGLHIPPAPGSAVVVGLGDSVTSGTACNCETFVRLYANGLPGALGGPATAVNLGEAGQTSAGLLSELEHSSRERASVARASVVLVTIGANDLQPQEAAFIKDGCSASCYQGAVDADGSRIEAILKQVRSIDAANRPLILVTGYWNVFLDGQVARARYGEAYVDWSSALTRDLNTRIAADARASAAVYVDLYAPFKGDGGTDPTQILAQDGDHPNAQGHEVIAKAVLAATP